MTSRERRVSRGIVRLQLWPQQVACDEKSGTTAEVGAEGDRDEDQNNPWCSEFNYRISTSCGTNCGLEWCKAANQWWATQHPESLWSAEFSPTIQMTTFDSGLREIIMFPNVQSVFHLKLNRDFRLNKDVTEEITSRRGASAYRV